MRNEADHDTSALDSVIVDVETMLAALLRRERDGVDALGRLADRVRQRATVQDDVELGLAPSGAGAVARDREFLARNGARQIRQLAHKKKARIINKTFSQRSAI